MITFRTFVCFLALPALLHGHQESEIHRSFASATTIIDHGESSVALSRPDEDEYNALQRGRAESVSGVETSRTSRALFIGALIDIFQGLFISGADPTPSPPTPAPADFDVPSTANFSTVRINCGGGTVKDVAGNTWMGDAYHNGAGWSVGLSFENVFNILFGSEDSGLFQSYRVCNRLFQSPLLYKIPVPKGRYQVTMYFAELFTLAPDWRRFDIRVEDQLSFTSVDFAKESGGRKKAVAMSTMAIVEDGELVIEFDAINRDPFVSAIEVKGVPDAPAESPTAVPSRGTTNAESPATSNAPSIPPMGKPTISPTLLPSAATSTSDIGGSLSASPTRAPIPINTPTSLPYAVPTNAPVELPSIGLPNPSPSTPPAETPGKSPASFTMEPSVSPTAASRLHASPSASPTQHPNEYPTTEWPTRSSIVAPTDTPSALPSPSSTRVPVNIPTTESPTQLPTALPTNLPSPSPTVLLTNIPTFAPSVDPTHTTITSAPTVIPTTVAPIATPATLNPTQSPTSSPIKGTEFESIRINVGGDKFVDFQGNIWTADQFFSGGSTYNSGSTPISDTLNDELYQSERYGQFEYEIPLEPGDYEIILHFAEVYFKEPGSRVFSLVVEDLREENIDLLVIGGTKNRAFTIESLQVVDDGFLSIKSINIEDYAKLSAIEIHFKEIHTAHAVTQGPYTVVDNDNDGFAVISVDSSPSHTHGLGMVLTSWVWKKGTTVLGTGEMVDLTLPVGQHSVALTVTDSGGNDSTEVTTMTVLQYGFPDLESLSPASGSISGGYEVTLSGSGFTSASEIIVHFGLTELTGNDIQVVDANTIKLHAPVEAVAVPVQVTVESKPLGVSSNSKEFTFETAIPIAWNTKYITGFESVSVAAFGPDGKLYAGNTKGQIAKISLDDDFNILDSVVFTVVPWRAILGMAFDPMTTADETNPPVYFSSSQLYHGGSDSSSGKSINGKIQRASGANLDIVEDIVTGLPVADMDHAVNGIVFGDQGEIYIQIGSNTNGGLPGQLTGKQIQKENYFSSATNVAYLADPDFNGFIKYDKDDDGVPITTGVEVFAAGERNPFGICLHSNGYLYGTDNGPNLGYGDMKTGCGVSDYMPDVRTDDKINIIMKGSYLGHPNPIRASAMNDPRQCKWRHPEEPSDADYTAPLVIAPSSIGAIIEFQSDHFGGQMRGNLIYSKYTGELHRVILRPDGKGVIAQSDPPIGMVGGKGLGITQAPDGSLVEVQNPTNQMRVHRPNELATSQVKVNSVWPRRGGLAGGSTFKIFGNNLQKSSSETTVLVGGLGCPIKSLTATQITCTLPGGSGTVDVTVTVGAESYSFKRGYRFISGAR